MFHCKNSLWLWCVLLSAQSFAGFMGGECVGDAVTLPCEKNSWDLSGYALYLQPSTGVNGLINHHNLSNNNDFGLGANPKWSFGFALDALMHYATGNALGVTWYHLRASQTQNLKSPLSYQNIIMASPMPTNPTYYDDFTVTAAQFNINPQWDQVNIAFGKSLEMGLRDEVHFHGGLNYSRVANSGYSNFEGRTLLDGTSQNDHNTETMNVVYNGVGIRAGMDLFHHWEWGLKVYAKLAGSILAGANKSSYQFINVINTTTYSGLESVNRTSLVPELDGKLGYSYTYAMTQGDLSIDAGWFWANYFGALTIHEKNFGLQGAYFGLIWSGDWI